VKPSFFIGLRPFTDRIVRPGHSKIFIETTCQLNRTLTEQIPCPIIRKTSASLKVNKLCMKTHYGINYANNIFAYFDQLPSWFSPIDLENLRKSPMIFLGKTLVQPLNITCYYDNLTHLHIRWTQPDPKGYIQIILFSVVALCLTLIHCFDGCFCRKTSNRR